MRKSDGYLLVMVVAGAASCSDSGRAGRLPDAPPAPPVPIDAPVAIDAPLDTQPACVAPTIVNPSFETPEVPPPFQPPFLALTDTLPGWSGVIDVHHTSDLAAADGKQCVDLNQAGRVDAPLAQALTLVAGQAYELRFFHGINHNCNATARFEVRIGGAIQQYDSGNTLVEAVLPFVAGAANSTLEFRSLTEGCGAATIDHVRISCGTTALP